METSKQAGFSGISVLATILLIFAVLMTVGLVGFYRIRADTLKDESISAQEDRAREIANNIEAYLLNARQLANTTATLAAPMREDRTQVETLITRVLQSAPSELIYGIGVWFEPNVFDVDEPLFGPYAHQPESAGESPVLTYEWTTPEYNFPTQGWYLDGKAGAGEVVFTEPYYDTGLVYMSASRAFYNDQAEFIGVVTVDMVLPQLYDLITAANVNPDETIYVTTASGAIFVHPDQDRILNFARSQGLNPTSILDLNERDLARFEEARTTSDRIEAMMPVAYTNWAVHIASDEEFIFQDVADLRNTILYVLIGVWLVVVLLMPVLVRLRNQQQKSRARNAQLEAEVLQRKLAEEGLQRVNEELEKRVQERTLELQKAKEEAEQASKVKSKFLASMSHELRTPLNSILNFSELVADGDLGDINEEQADALHDVVSNGEHLLSLINDILDLTKIEVGMMELFIEEVNLNIMAESVFSTAKGLVKEKSIELITEVEPGLPTIKGDKRRLRQIFLNLISNAVKFTEKGSVTIKLKREDDLLHLSVCDTGLGIAPEEQALIFESFRQGSHGLQNSGTGLGLPITKALIEAHQGKIWVESQLGAGTTFHVTIPIKVNEAVAAG